MNEVDLFVGRDFVVTLHDGNFKSLRRLFAAVASDEPARAQLLGRGSGYLLYRIIDTLIKPCFSLLYRLEDDLDQLDTRLFKGDTQTIVRDLATLRRDITTLYHILKPNVAVGEALRNIDAPFVKLDTARYFGHNTDGFARLQNMTEELQQITNGLTLTLDSITAQHTNKVLRVIVLILCFLVPLALISALAGLNVVLLFNTGPLIFGGVMGAVVVITAAIIAFVRSRRWL